MILTCCHLESTLELEKFKKKIKVNDHLIGKDL